MLRTELIELINRGQVWAFLGSGVSADAGLPTWRGLVEIVTNGLDPKHKAALAADTRYVSGLKNRLYAQCFSRIQEIAGRDQLIGGIENEFKRHQGLGELLRILADWPFAGYVTSNYDLLIKKALSSIGQHSGWSEAGNSQSEVRKLSGNAEKIIWHVHGAVERDERNFRMVVTEEDYEALYLDGSPVVTQLRSLLTHKRVVFVGFGFNDDELKRLLKWVRMFSSPVRPAYAFLSGVNSEDLRLELLEKYNVDVIPYEVINDSHRQLIHTLGVYGSFILKRSLKFDQPSRPCPSYHPETTSLLVYNQLALNRKVDIKDDTLGSLLKSRMLSLLHVKGPQTKEALVNDLAERVRIVRGVPAEDHQQAEALVERYLAELALSGFVETGDPNRLTNDGEELGAEQSGLAARLHDQFKSSLEDRASRYDGALSPTSVTAVAKAAEAFFSSCIEHRALGVAMSWYSPNANIKNYHVLALLQELPRFMQQLKPPEAMSLVSLVQGILAQPTAEESRYLGLALQARFAVTILGYDPNVVQARLRELSSTLFLLDASMLIHLLSRSSVGNESARSLLERLKAVKAPLATTPALNIEVAEHARWAIDHVSPKAGLSPELLLIADGRAGFHENQFLDGFLHEVTKQATSSDFAAYLDSAIGHPRAHSASDDVFASSIEASGISVIPFNKWQGFDKDLYWERDRIAENIAERRKGSQTFKHDRQVQAEAEALIIIEQLRDGKFGIDGASVKAAYFISNTRAIDQVTDAKLPITMRPSSVLQWLSTLVPVSSDDLASLVSALLWEMSERGFTVVDKTHLQNAFSPLISASESKLQEEIALNGNLVANRYGEPEVRAFSEAKGIDAAVALHSMYAQRSADLEAQLQKERAEKVVAVANAKLSDKDRQDLVKFRSRQEQKHKRAKAKSKFGKKNKKKNKRKGNRK